MANFFDFQIDVVGDIQRGRLSDARWRVPLAFKFFIVDF